MLRTPPFPKVALPPQAVSLEGRTPQLAAGKWPRWQLAVILLLTGWLYFPVLSHLVYQWSHDQNFSHGFFVPAFSLFVVWQQRTRLAAIPARPSYWGLPLIVFALAVLVVGALGAELFLSRISLLILIAGLVVFFRGWEFFRAVLFPWAFLILMVPLPAIIFNQITFPLQVLTSKVASTVLPWLGVPVFREGNLIHLPAMKDPLEVAEACSGIRSLLSLLTLSIIYGQLMETQRWVRFALALGAVPIAVAANSFRIVGTGLVVQNWNPDKALGFYHSFEGFLIFLVSLSMLFALHQLLRWRSRGEEGATT